MSQLVSPSAALGQAFVLPKVGLAESQSTVSMPKERIIAGYGVVVGNIGLVLPTAVTSRLVEADIALCHLPTAPAWLLGMANLEGNAVPLFDIEALLGFTRETAPIQYLVLGVGEEAAGITISKQPQRLHLRPEQKMARNPPLPAALKSCVIACYRDEQVWVEWDFRAFFEAAGERM